MSFSIELELQKFPKVVPLKDGSKATLRPLRPDDEKEFHGLFLSIPETERMFIKHRVAEIETIRDWCRNLDYGRNLPLVALIGGKIVGDATLHQQLGGWRRHIGRVSVLVHPESPGRGLATKLIEETLDIARRLRRITAGSATLFIVNDDVEIAADSGADGVHLGQDDMSLAAARAQWPAPGKVFGLSTHNEDQERRARDLAPDYIGVGPVFATPTKEQPDPTLGLERMGRIVRASPLATVAIGGIDRHNLPAILHHGAVNFCVLRAVNLDPDPLSAISALQAIWRAHLAAQ